MVISGGCCQTTSGTGESVIGLVTPGLSHADQEPRRGRFNPRLGTPSEHSQFHCSVRPVDEVRSVLQVWSSTEVACLPHWLSSNISLRDDYVFTSSTR